MIKVCYSGLGMGDEKFDNNFYRRVCALNIGSGIHRQKKKKSESIIKKRYKLNIFQL